MTDWNMYLSFHQWHAGLRDEAFESLDKAVEHSKALDIISDCPDPDPKYTSGLIEGISMEKSRWAFQPSTTQKMPENWPEWVPLDLEEEKIKAEMAADPRWDEWVKKTKA